VVDVVRSPRSDVRKAWAVHAFTALGASAGILALEAVVSGKPRLAIFYLLVTQIIDGIDGPMARQIDIRQAAPKIDGYILDLVIDYFTCVVVPVAFMHQFKLVPAPASAFLACAIVFFSAMWFSRTDMMTEDNWFNGFPSTWNLMIPTMLFLELPKIANAAMCVFFIGLLLTNIKFPHPVRSEGPRALNLAAIGLWIVVLSYGTWRYPTVDMPVKVLLVLVFGYFTGLSAWKGRQVKTNGVSQLVQVA
jgi:phosphatidylcholine synthase